MDLVTDLRMQDIIAGIEASNQGYANIMNTILENLRFFTVSSTGYRTFSTTQQVQKVLSATADAVERMLGYVAEDQSDKYYQGLDDVASGLRGLIDPFNEDELILEIFTRNLTGIYSALLIANTKNIIIQTIKAQKDQVNREPLNVVKQGLEAIAQGEDATRIFYQTHLESHPYPL